MKLNFLSFFVIYFLLIGCHAVECEKTTAEDLDIDDKGLDFQIYSSAGKYWGEFVLYEVDHTISYANNSGMKFREDIKDLEFVRYNGSSQDGVLSLKWPNEKEPVCIAKVPYTYWLEIKKLSSQWEESKKFIP